MKIFDLFEFLFKGMKFLSVKLVPTDLSLVCIMDQFNQNSVQLRLTLQKVVLIQKFVRKKREKLLFYLSYNKLLNDFLNELF